MISQALGVIERLAQRRGMGISTGQGHGNPFLERDGMGWDGGPLPCLVSDTIVRSTNKNKTRFQALRIGAPYT